MISKKGYKILKLIKDNKFDKACEIDGQSETIEYFIEQKYILVYLDSSCTLLARGEEALESYVESKKELRQANIQSIVSLIISGLALISSILLGILLKTWRPCLHI